MRILKLVLQDCCGASAAEYALLLAIIGGAIILAAVALGIAISGSVSRASSEIESCGGGC